LVRRVTMDLKLKQTQKHWEQFSTIRARPQRNLMACKNQSGDFYPLAKQAMCIHPEIIKLGEEVKHYLLIQSFYRYALDIIELETDIVNQSTMYIVNKKLPVNLNYESRRDALTIIIDEAYHAYVALDGLLQIENLTGIKPISFDYDMSITKAISLVKRSIPESMQIAFELIAVCIAENTNTQDILAMIREKELHEFFTNILCDHYADEARHSVFFERVMIEFWSKLTPEFQIEIGLKLPIFITEYLSNESQKEFDIKLLESLSIKQETIIQVINDTYGEQKITAHHPMLRNIMKLLDKSKVLLNPIIANKFSELNWSVTD
jgi:P-aminobenzoate N-oxygenase AurF